MSCAALAASVFASCSTNPDTCGGVDVVTSHSVYDRHVCWKTDENGKHLYVDGPVLVYKEGSLVTRGQYTDGKMTGKWISYSSDGAVIHVCDVDDAQSDCVVSADGR